VNFKIIFETIHVSVGEKKNFDNIKIHDMHVKKSVKNIYEFEFGDNVQRSVRQR